MLKIFKKLYVQVLIAIALGVLLGHFYPDLGAKMEPLGTGFIKLIKMLIAPIIFTTVVAGIAGMGDLKKIGRVGLKSLIYFEAVTTLALIIGMVVVNVFQPGAGIHADPVALKASAEVAKYTKAAAGQSTADFILHIIPNTFVSAFAEGEILQVLLLAVLFGFALTHLGEKAQRVTDLLNDVMKAFFNMVGMVARLAPIGAFGAMAFTIGKYGLGSLVSLGQLMLCVYVTCILFVFLVLGAIAWTNGFNIWKILKYIREELLIVLGTSSSESALPLLMQKMEKVGCARSVVGIVLPAGYSFNLDGTSIYLTMAAIFIAQAMGVHLTIGEEIGILAVLLLTSKGAAGVTGSGFITLAATLSATHGKIPVEGLALILGVDRFMSEARAITNIIGNTVAMLVISRWEKAFDRSKAGEILRGEPNV